jgi:glycosyltransferase involved in cell wall biosynthesis
VHPAVHEGFGMTPLEAMAAGTAVVASTAGAIPEVVGEAGLLVDPQDVDAWAGALSEVGGDDDLRRRLEDSGRTRAGAFTWEATARRTLAVYDAVTG